VHLVFSLGRPFHAKRREKFAQPRLPFFTCQFPAGYGPPTQPMLWS
jgi:hypothetical protein